MSVVKTIRPYHGPAGGWDALKAVAEALAEQHSILGTSGTLLRVNQPEGFDCPGCAWPDPKHTSSFEFCENGAKAVAWESTAKRCTPEFFASHTVAELETWSDYELEMEGRLTHSMYYDATSDRYLPISWDGAFTLIGRHLNALPTPDAADFYTSGRASNEAAFLYQLFVREYGTNNFPDLLEYVPRSNERGSPAVPWRREGHLSARRFRHGGRDIHIRTESGHQQPTYVDKSPQSLPTGATIISFNPFRERSLERFQAPQDPVEMATLTSTPISSALYQVKVGGDVALLKGLMKSLIEADDAAELADTPRVLDWDFIRGHTLGIKALCADLRAPAWEDIERGSGLTRDQIKAAAKVYMEAPSTILVAWGLRSTGAALKTFSNLQISLSCAAISGARGRASARCVDIPMFRGTGPLE